MPPASQVPTIPHLQLCSFVIKLAFVGTNICVKARQWLLCHGSSSRLFYKRFKVTLGLPCISPGVALDKTPSTSKWKFMIGRLTSSISIIKFGANGTLEESGLI